MRSPTAAAAAAAASAILLALAASSSPHPACAFSPAAAPAATATRRHVRSAAAVHHASAAKGDDDGAADEPTTKPTTMATTSRRSLLTGGLAALTAGAASPLLIVRGASASTATAATDAAAAASASASAIPDLKCLLDLPPVNPDCVRLYLCRHGQTENNRLHLVQGSRIDPPLNDNGVHMARRIGMALSYLPADEAPRAAVNSALRRARETATLATGTYGRIRASSSSGERRWYDYSPAEFVDAADPNPPSAFESLYAAAFAPPPANAAETSSPSSSLPYADEYLSRAAMDLSTLKSLGEVDFGPGLEGRSTAEVRTGMYATYGLWSAGRIDERMNGEGESGREVLGRAANALTELSTLAASSGGSLVAVSHSTYLRMLLATALEMPLAQAAVQLKQENCCVNVLDVNIAGRTRVIGHKSDLFGGKTSLAGRDFELRIPETTVVRVGESRHLRGLI